MTRLGHIPALDGLRGIAILLVLAFHSGLLPGGALGVDLFFVLSGFLITSLLLTEWDRKGEVSLGAFYRRRALRLLPALVALVAVVLTLSVTPWQLRPAQDALEGAVLGLLYISNLAFAYGGVDADFTFFWSLAQEEQFYLLWPPVLVILLLRHVDPRTIAYGLAGVAAVIIAWRTAAIAGGVSYRHLWMGPDMRADTIVVGCLAGVAYSFGLVTRIPVRTLALLAGAAVLAVLVPSRDLELAFLLPAFTLATAFVILAIALDERWWVGRALTFRPLRYLGTISYGLYLWHGPIAGRLGWEIGFPVAIAVAAVSYRYVEQPFLRRKRRVPEAPPTPRVPQPEVAAAT